MAATAEYGRIDYWDFRYRRDDFFFDWYQKYAGVRDIIREHVAKKDRVLVIGCGRSRISEEMARDGYDDVLSTDASKIAVEAMRSHYGNKLRFEVADVTDLTRFSHGEFDAVIDKGCFDCILCGENSTERATNALQQISRVVRPGGIYISVSYNQPMFRMNYLDRPQLKWDVAVRVVPKARAKDDANAVHYVYLCRRSSEAFDGGMTARQTPMAPAENTFAPERSVEFAQTESVALQAEPLRPQRTASRISNAEEDWRKDEAKPPSKQWARKEISKEPVYSLDG